MRPFVSGLVLAAGASSRLGQPKQLLTVAVTYLVPQTLLFVPMADLIGRMKLGNTKRRSGAKRRLWAPIPRFWELWSKKALGR